MTDARTQELHRAAELLIQARRTGERLADLPAELQPVDVAETSFVQDLVAAAFGPVGGWKIGAAGADATPAFAPMPAAWMHPNGVTLPGERFHLRAVEAEIAFLVGEDLPPRATPYTREEVLAAMASCHPAIELLETGLTGLATPALASRNADIQVHGGFLAGPAIENWQAIDFSREHVTVQVDDAVAEDRTGSNTSGDLLRLLPWLANEGATRTGGLKRGQWITTGSWTGNTPVGPHATVVVHFASAQPVQLRFV